MVKLMLVLLSFVSTVSFAGDCKNVFQTWVDLNTRQGFKPDGQEPIGQVGVVLIMASGKDVQAILFVVKQPQVTAFFDSEVRKGKLKEGGICTVEGQPHAYYFGPIEENPRT